MPRRRARVRPCAFVEAIDLELQVTASEATEGGGGFKFWVVNGEAKGKVAAESIQKVHLKLKPIALDRGGNEKPLDVEDERAIGG